jgi:hypothetical protein
LRYHVHTLNGPVWTPECRAVKIGYKSFENVGKFKYLGTTATNGNYVHEEIKGRLNMGNPCSNSVQNLLSSLLLSRKSINARTLFLYVVLYGCET